jgi:hypothetical protein
MTKCCLALKVGIAAVIATIPTVSAHAQFMLTGGELNGHSMNVTADGITNTVYFEAGGKARIIPAGGGDVAAEWWVDDGTLCVSIPDAEECFPYTTPFQAGHAVLLTSDCGSAVTWLPITAEPLPVEMPKERLRSGERG